jgi:predicted PurR-regulated permease PerM
LVRSLNLASSTPSSKSSLIIAAGVVIAMLYFGRQIFIPIGLALVLSFLLTPLVGWLQRLRFGRVPAVLTVMICCFALAVFVGWGVAGQLLQITAHIQDYRDNLEQKIHSLHAHNNAPLVQATATVQELNKELAAAPNEAAKSAKAKDGSPHPPRPIPVQVTSPPSNFLQDLRTVLGPLTDVIEIIVLVIIFLGFMLIYREDLRNRLIRLGGQGQLTVVTQALEDASQRLSRYLFLQFLVNACYGSLFGLGLYFIGIPHALLWGTLAGLLRFIPYIGTWIAMAFPILMSLAVFPGWRHATLSFALFAVLELITANVIEPWLYGSNTGISPLAILVAAVFWATLWGPVGLILSTPLTLCLILVGRYVPQMTFLEVLLGDEPALTPSELFYQRLLAMDPDEARNIAEKYFRENGLQNLYETVLISALRLSEEDRHTGVLTDQTAEFIAQSTRELIDDIGDLAVRQRIESQNDASSEANDKAQKQDKQIAPEVLRFQSTRIICVPARDEADELVGMMLAQLLEHGGNKAVSFVPIGTVENMLDRVERGNFTIVCVSALPPFAVGQARSLCKRLHARLPALRIVVGLWGFSGGVPKAQERIGATCTDAVCTTLSEAILQLRRLAELDVLSQEPELQHKPSSHAA